MTIRKYIFTTLVVAYILSLAGVIGTAFAQSPAELMRTCQERSASLQIAITSRGLTQLFRGTTDTGHTFVIFGNILRQDFLVVRERRQNGKIVWCTVSEGRVTRFYGFN